MAERASVTTFIMEDRLPWPDEIAAPGVDGPLDAGVIHDSGVRLDCSIRRISALGATLRGPSLGAPGHVLAIELATGHRPAAVVDWVAAGEAGVVFKQPIDVLALINRTLVSQPVERRTMPRVELRCVLKVKYGENFVPAMLRNISAGGLQVEGEILPQIGSYVAVEVEGLIVPPGEIVWRRENVAGIELFEELSWTSLMPWIREQAGRSQKPQPRGKAA
ncbi:MAG TPA: PilZ domain-containing protein [Sphingomicrobium sp.]|nr:PilZ domain-containing protein [Sphingomicrobium sp.]